MTANDFYLNVAKYGNDILVCGYRDGQRYRQKVKYEPYLFLPDKAGTYKNLWDEPVKRKDFSSIREAQKFLDRYKNVDGFKWYGYDRWVYPFIHDNWLGEIKPDLSQIKTHILDIEVGRNPAGQFAKVENADGPVTLIGFRFKDERIILGYEKYSDVVETTRGTEISPNCHYIRCRDEKHLLEKFISLWEDEENRPDVVTGWNIEKYDIPYLVNRIKKVLGEGHAERLSPWGILREKTIEWYGKEQQVYIPVGLAVLDYFDLYKKFTQGKQLESFTLEHVAFHEVGRGKLDFRSAGYASLEELYERNFQLFVEYNIHDLDRVFEIDEKNRFIDLAFTIAYQAKVNPIDSLTSVSLWEVISHNYLLDRGIVFHHDMKSESKSLIGGFNFPVRVGPSKWVVSFDLQSLYPHLMMWANISPECYVDMDSWPHHKDDKDVVVVPKHNNIIAGLFKERSNFARAGNGARFRRDRQGFMGQLMKQYFALRKSYKDQMLDTIKAEGDKYEIARLNRAQMAIKIMINSFYGVTGNPGFAFYNWRLSSAITLSAQLAIKWVENRLNEVLNKTFGVDIRWTVAGDTDSLYLDVSAVVEKVLPGETDSKKVVDFLDKFCADFLQPEIQKAYEELGRVMNAYEPDKLIMKRDVIAGPKKPEGNGAIWRAKKCYAMYAWDEEGVRYPEPKLKIMGLEVVKAIIPQVCRDGFKHVIGLILDGDKEGTQEFITEFRKRFDTLKVEEIAFPRGCNGLDEYSDSTTIWKKGTPIHVKGALSYNFQLQKRQLESQYSLVHSGEKVKFVHLREPNTTGAGVISFPQILPQELNLHRFVDYDKMFEKTFLEPAKSLMDLLKWEIREKRNTLEALFG